MEEAGREEGRDKPDVWKEARRTRGQQIVAEKLNDAGNVGWWGEYGALQRKYVITEEDQARREWKAKVEEGNDQDWWEEVESKSSLGWYRMAKNEFRL